MKRSRTSIEWEYKLYILIVYLVLMAAIFASAAEGQIIRRPTPPDCRMVCAISPPEVCELCMSQSAFRRVRPVDTSFYDLPFSVGVAMPANHEPLPENPGVLQHWTMCELFDELRVHGVSSASIYPADLPWYPELEPHWDYPGMDLIVIRPDSIAWTFTERGCNGRLFESFSEYDIALYAEWLYSTYSHVEKTIIFTEWEYDWFLRRPACDCEESEAQERSWFVTHSIKQRQLALAAVRAAWEQLPTTKLRLRYSVTVNYPGGGDCGDDPTVARIIGGLEPDAQPDYVFVSAWGGGASVGDLLDRVAGETGFPRYRIQVGEIGVPTSADQYSLLKEKVRAAWDWGVRAVFIWTWKEHWCGEPQNGLWTKPDCDGRVVWGEPTPGYWALMELLEEAYERNN